MAITVLEEIEVDRGADEVFAFLSDSANNPTWQAGMRRCVWTTPPPIDVGSRYEQEARFLGRTIRSSFEVTAYEPGRSVRIETIEGSFPITVTRSVEPVDHGRTLVRARIEGDASGFFRIAEPLLRRMVQRSVDGDYARLKQLLESDTSD